MWVQSSQEEASPINCDTCKRMIDEEDYPRHWPACRAQRQPNQQQKQEERPHVQQDGVASSSVDSSQKLEEEDSQTFRCQNCSQVLPLTVIEDHTQRCSLSDIEIECKYCHFKVRSVQIETHEERCESNPRQLNLINSLLQGNVMRNSQQNGFRVILGGNIAAYNPVNVPQGHPFREALQNSIFVSLREVDNGKGIKNEDLKKFPVEEYRKQIYADQEKCPICQQEFQQGDKIMKIVCIHIYHEHCYKTWLAKDNTCPICKAVITTNKQHPRNNPNQ